MRKAYIFFLVVLLISSCQKIEKSSKNQVTVSIAPLKWAVEQIADTLVRVEILVPEAASAENFDPTSRQVASLSKSDLYFSTGLLDFEMAIKENIKSFDKNLKVIELNNSVDVINEECEDHHDHGDPHIWLSVRNMRKISLTIKDELVAEYPGYQEIFIDRYNKLDSALRSMDMDFSKRFTGREKVLIVHPSLTYLSRDYSFKQIAVEHEGKEPSASYLKTIFDLIKTDSIQAIFYSKQDNPTEAKNIASEANINAIEYDPLSPDWKDDLSFLVDKICLK